MEWVSVHALTPRPGDMFLLFFLSTGLARSLQKTAGDLHGVLVLRSDQKIEIVDNVDIRYRFLNPSDKNSTRERHPRHSDGSSMSKRDLQLGE